jgi:hypothetical protein
MMFVYYNLLLQPFQYIPTITNYTQLWWLPNVVVAHQKEGIEAVHLASGRTLCKVNVGNMALCHHVVYMEEHLIAKNEIQLIIGTLIMCQSSSCC